MSLLRGLCAALTALAVLLSTPITALASCTRCPPDCPMHAKHEDRGSSHGGDEVGDPHRAHEGAIDHRAAEDPTAEHHPADHRAADDGGAHRHAIAHRGGAQPGDPGCHRALPPAPAEEGPCFTATCGHHEAIFAPALPEGVVPSARIASPALPALPVSVGSSRFRPIPAPQPETGPPRPSFV